MCGAATKYCKPCVQAIAAAHSDGNVNYTHRLGQAGVGLTLAIGIVHGHVHRCLVVARLVDGALPGGVGACTIG